MLLNQNNETLIVSTTDQVHTNFRIAMNAKAFRALSDSLYKNKIGTIVREISCNAMDGHIAAKKPDVPFEIHLPDNLEPYFSVKDYGVGMSHESIITLYSTFFESTKDKSNDEIGGFGLGSKTPYAYTDSFTVTSIWNGVKTYYSAYLNEGLPTISRLQSEETTEGNGVEVKIGVKREDYSTFRQEVHNQLQYFTTKPIIKNGKITFDNKFNEPVLNTENITLINPTSKYNSEYHNTAVLGVVGYPIDDDILNKHLDKQSVSFLRMIRGIALIKFKIGEMEVTASREGISYTEQTIKNLINKIAAARKDVLEYLRTSVDLIPTGWEKAVFVNNSGPLINLYITSGFKIEHATVYNDQYVFEIKDVLTRSKHGLVSFRFSRDGKGDTFRRDNSYNTYIVPKSNKILFYRDIDKGPIPRVREINLQDRKLESFVFEDYGDSEEFLPETELVDLINELQTRMGDVKITRISALPEYKRPKIIRTKVAADGSAIDEEIDYKIPKGYIVSIRKISGLTKISARSADPIYDISELEGAYMLYENREIVKPVITHGTITRKADHLLNLINELSPTNVSEVYVINSKYLKKIQKNPNLFPLEQYAIEAYNNFVPKTAYIKKILTLKEINEKLSNWIPHSYMNEFISNKYYSKFEKKNIGGYMIRLHRVLTNRYNTDANEWHYKDSFPELFTDSNEQTKLYDKFMEKFEQANACYPILSDIRTYGIDATKIEHMIKYINVMGNG